MQGRVWIVLLAFAGSAVAQFDGGTVLRHVRVRVDFVNGVCDASTRVSLAGISGPVAEGAPNNECEVDFANVPVGTYHLNVSGQNFTESDIITASTIETDFEVKVKRADSARGAGAMVSAADLGVPPRAQKEFDKANKLIDDKELSKAIKALERAIAIYPTYANAYNNLGVIYARIGDRDHERAALEKAISINDHFAPAYVNVGRMKIATNDFAGAESALLKATACDPLDAMSFVLLGYAEFMNHHVDQAIAASHKAHTLDGPHAFVHEVAARAYAQKHDAKNAIAELELFLQEEPTGERAEGARKELAALQAIPH